MPEPVRYPKRLIEVDLPIRRISAHSRREKSIRHGHISTLHIWWARRPLAACRAVVCASLWPDPADDLCPQSFRDAARNQMNRWAREHLSLLSPESYARFNAAAKDARHFDDDVELRKALLDFIADFANWDNSTVPEYLETSRDLTQAAHEALGGTPGTKPLVVDPFAGGGSIPLEALRVGADAFASDLNPVAVLLNKVVLDYIPTYGARLAEQVKSWGEWIRTEAERELADVYPKGPGGETPLAYLWARTIRCEGPTCGIEVPLIRSPWLERVRGRATSLRLAGVRGARLHYEVVVGRDKADSSAATVRLGAATCPICGYTTPVERVRTQLKVRRGGSADARLLCVVSTREGRSGREFRVPTPEDEAAVKEARARLAENAAANDLGFPVVPTESTPEDGTGGRGGGYRTRKYGLEEFGDFFSPRQLLALTTLARLVREAVRRISLSSSNLDSAGTDGAGLAEATASILATTFDRVLSRCTANCVWDSTTLCVMQVFNQGQSLPFRSEYVEMIPTADEGSGLSTSVDYALKVIDALAGVEGVATVAQADAAVSSLPDDAANAFVTDPPYYDAVPYAELSDFFFVWLKRLLSSSMFKSEHAPKDQECVVDLNRGKDRTFFETKLGAALSEGRRVLRPDGVGVVVFAHKSTAGWESMLQALTQSGWVVTSSWPIDTESGNRLRAKGSAALASSVHVAVRPREDVDGTVAEDRLGDWRAVLHELPRRLHEWMPRLAEEGVVGADAIFACLGPALEIFSRYSRVEKASGEVVTLKEYLEHVWAAVAKEALSMIFADPETSGLEPDARLTAMWLWTVAAPAAAGAAEDEEADAEEDDEEDGKPAGKLAGFVLEFDAARKIAQGLGAKLEEMPGVVEVKGEKARLLPVSERARFLFGGGRSAGTDARATRGRGRVKQGNLFREVEEVVEEAERSELGAPGEGKTTLDRIHQAMLLFGAGRSEALRRFLVDDGAGRATGFWKLAQSLSALYPKASEEKRWVDGVLARKKSLGF